MQEATPGSKKKLTSRRIQGFFAFAVGIGFILSVFLIVRAVVPGISAPTFGPTDDDVQPDYLRNVQLVENQISTCGGALSAVEALCPVGYKVSGGGCYGGTTSWINDCQDNNGKSDRSGWECNCNCSSGSTLIAQAVCVNSQ